ncbi:3-hydroxyisobutyryl-CoA hydrolase 1 [Zea mays]|uniref:3-hydroxyisobutyryl-CoA hydrolase n=1 Tax=Zea mays TaxID=4577 RepID=A0A1D6F8H8_MAIZE|nr:3-hydroxyisobutyryl-CoA hydrolase 1 [Zea mays]
MFFIEVSLLTGIVMGGGAGVSLHGKFRVATNNTVFAMPETSLGLFPDVGASYFLARLPGFYGEYVALVGARLDGAEMLACGLATHFVPSNVDDGGLFWGACSGCLQGWNKCMMMQLKSISLGLMIQSGKIWTYLSCIQMEELWSPSFEWSLY